MRKSVLLLLLGFMFSIAAFSQGTLRGKIVDSTFNKPLGFATITVFKASDTAIITYRLSSPDGDFKVPGIPFDVNCRVVVSYSGYGVYRKEFIITQANSTLDIGTIPMTTDAKSLDEILLIAERPPVVMKKDTIEFNASAFKTLPNALVEDLLKKLPGVMVDGDGNITVNGKPVNRILVDGKVFFGDDPKMATRNLPANVIDKVQVMDDKEEMMRSGDDNPNNVGKVVNITLKKGVKKGWFGKVYAGGGTDKLYEAGGIANIYRDTLQVSVLGYMNNLSKTGFSYGELMSAGGFDRNRANNASNNTSVSNNRGGSSVTINGVNFGGSQNYGGISTSTGAGFNLNHAPNKKRSFYLQYFNGNVHTRRLINTGINQYNGDTIVSTNTRLTGDVISHGHNIGTGLRLKPDSVTNILINVNYTIGLQGEDRFNDINGYNNKFGPLSNGNVIQDNGAKTYYYRHNIAFTRVSKKKNGRRFNFIQTLDINNRYNDYVTESAIRYIYPVMFDSLYAQLRQESIPRTDASVMFNYSDPWGKKFSLRVGGRYEFSKLSNGVNTYNRIAGNEKFDVLNTLLSSNFRRISNRFNLITGVEYKLKGVSITPSVRFMQQNVNNRLVSPNTILKQRQFDILPQVAVVYKQLTISYGKDVQLPAFNYLNPVTDLSNPYFIVKGNPSLLPARRNTFAINYYMNDPKRYFNAGGYANAIFTKRDIVQVITLDEKGVQTSYPVNTNGTRSYNMNWNVNKQYRSKQNVILMWNTGNQMSVTKSRLFFNGLTTWQTTFRYNHWAGVGINLKDKFEWNMNYGLAKNFTRYSDNHFRKLDIFEHGLTNELVLRWPKHLVWETQYSYTHNGSIPSGLPKDNHRWNGALNITMLKNDVGVLKLAVNDILNKNKRINVIANQNVVTSIEDNILGRYFLATFSYTVRPGGARRKVGGRDSLFNF